MKVGFRRNIIVILTYFICIKAQENNGGKVTTTEQPTTLDPYYENCFKIEKKIEVSTTLKPKTEKDQETTTVTPENHYIDDIMENYRKPRIEKTIFFHIINCMYGEINLKSRQACAIESAAKNNPNFDIFVLFASPVKNGSDTEAAMKALNNYTNIFFRNNDLWLYTKGTVAERLLKYFEFKGRTFLGAHLTEILQYVSLFRWGGIYMDPKVIVLKSFENFPRNFAGASYDNLVGSGVLGLSIDGPGRFIALEGLRRLMVRGKNGVITEVLTEEVCNKTCEKRYTPNFCSDITVFPKTEFYPIPKWDRSIYFSPHYRKEAMQKTEKSSLIYVWNDWLFPYRENMPVGNDYAYGIYAKKHCPQTFKNVEYF